MNPKRDPHVLDARNLKVPGPLNVNMEVMELREIVKLCPFAKN